MSVARKRWPGSPVNYVKADLLALPPKWNQAFSLVFESLTIQSLPRKRPRRPPSKACARWSRRWNASGGRDAVADDAPAEADPPWPLTERELRSIAADSLQLISLERIPIPGEPGLSRWRAVFERQG